MPPKKQEKPAEEPQPAPDLLAFYKQRVDEFEQERANLLEQVDKCAVQASELHRLEWENRKRADEVRELQKALSDAHAFLFEERQRLLTLQAENDELRLQEIEDRKRIQQLLGQGGKNMQQGSNMAHYSVDALLLKVESLQAQLNEQKQLAAERIAALLEDRRIREGEEEMHRAHMNQQLEVAADKLRRVEEQLRMTTKDYILARRDKQGAEEMAVACEAALLEERTRTAEEVSTLRRRAEKELRDARAAADSRLDDIATNLRKQLKAKEDELISITSVHTSLKSQYDTRIAELEGKVAKLHTANKNLDARRHREFEGFTADVTLLRKMLTAVDRKLHEMRLVERLEDDDRLDTILEGLRRKAPMPVPLLPEGGGKGARDAGPGARDDAASVKGELASGLKEMRGRLKGLEDRLSTRRQAMSLEQAGGA